MKKLLTTLTILTLCPLIACPQSDTPVPLTEQINSDIELSCKVKEDTLFKGNIPAGELIEKGTQVSPFNLKLFLEALPINIGSLSYWHYATFEWDDKKKIYSAVNTFYGDMEIIIKKNMNSLELEFVHNIGMDQESSMELECSKSTN